MRHPATMAALTGCTATDQRTKKPIWQDSGVPTLKCPAEAADVAWHESLLEGM